MRKITSMLFMLLIAFSTMFAERISHEEAALIANNFMNPATETTIRKAPTKKMVLKKAPAQQENQFYVYENTNGEGWVMVAGNDAAHPIIGFSETGKFSFEGLPVNLQKWLSGYNKELKSAQELGLVAGEEVAAEWKALRSGNKMPKAGSVVVAPLIKTIWDQDEPFNLLCPGTGTWGEDSNKAASGCVATAMSQVMNYWQWPVSGTGSHSYQPLLDIYNDWGYYQETIEYYKGQLSADFEHTVYDWDNMKDSYKSSYTTAEGNAVATLMFHCGVALEMQYGDYAHDGSGAWTIDYDGYWSGQNTPCVETVLPKYFKYKSTLKGLSKDKMTQQNDGVNMAGHTDAEWKALIKEELDNKRPIMYDGSGTYGGHSFILDGYRSDDYYHFNWGWSGEDDGYFKLTSLAPGDNGGIGGGGYDFSSSQCMIIGIEPDKPLSDDETSLKYNLTGVDQISGQQQGTIKKNEAVVATFEAKDGYYELANDENTSVSVTIGGTKGDYASFNSGVLTISIPADKVTDAIVISVVATRDLSKVNYYEKVTSNLQDWTGTYLIVYEDDQLAFNGGLSSLDAVSNTINVTIASDLIEVTDATKEAEFSIAKSGSDYTIKSASGYYIGKTNSNSNGLDQKATELTNTISYNGSSVDVVSSGGLYLRYNSTSNQTRFRYYKATSYTNQKAIQLYKKLGNNAQTSLDEIDYSAEEIVSVYNLLGQKVGTSISNLTYGVYVVKTTMRTYKILVNK